MLTRALCLTLVLCGGPASPWTASLCCDPSEACCGDELPSCPALPDGECSIAATGQTLATVNPTSHQQPFALLRALDAPEGIALSRPGLLHASLRHPPPPRFLDFQSLRN